MGTFESGYNLPPGVSPNDPHIVGYPEFDCPDCGEPSDADDPREPDGDPCTHPCHDEDGEWMREQAEAEAEPPEDENSER